MGQRAFSECRIGQGGIRRGTALHVLATRFLDHLRVGWSPSSPSLSQLFALHRIALHNSSLVPLPSILNHATWYTQSFGEEI